MKRIQEMTAKEAIKAAQRTVKMYRFMFPECKVQLDAYSSSVIVYDDYENPMIVGTIQ